MGLLQTCAATVAPMLRTTRLSECSWGFPLARGFLFVIISTIHMYCETEYSNTNRYDHFEYILKDLLAILEHTGHETAVLVGHDW